jgi:large subunit ribosomal protein L25
MMDSSRVVADLRHRDGERHEIVTLSAENLKKTLEDNKGLGILDVQLPEDAEPRKCIINKFVRKKNGQGLAHLVLKEVSDTDRIRSRVPIVAIGQLAESASKGTVLIQKLRALELKGPVGSMDHPIHVNVSRMQKNDVILAKDIELPEGVELNCDPETEVLRLRPVATS